MAGNKQGRNWIKPAMVRIGKISDVALGANPGTAQCNGGSSTCSTPARVLS